LSQQPPLQPQKILQPKAQQQHLPDGSENQRETPKIIQWSMVNDHFGKWINMWIKHTIF